jgi:hypothetical protein
MARYVDRDTLKSALSIPASTTDNHALLDAAIEGVSRLIDDYCGFPFAPSSGVRYYTARHSGCLSPDYPLTAVDSIRVDTSGDGGYGTSWTSSDFYLTPYNARVESPPRPYWEIETRPNSTATFPAGVRRGVQITGTWGYYDQRADTTATLATGVNATATALALNGATALHAGQMILLDSERMTVTATPASSTGSHSSGVSVVRGVNGTVAAAHTSGAVVAVYEYPIISEAARFQAQMDYRARDAPLGVAGGQAFGDQPLRASAGLHPFSRRMLDGFRKPGAW